MGGDNGSLNANFKKWDEQRREFSCVVGPSMRYVLDWSDVDDFTIHGNLGQSGNPFSPHYDDHLELMQKNLRWVVPFSREKVYEQTSSLLRLIPVD